MFSHEFFQFLDVSFSFFLFFVFLAFDHKNSQNFSAALQNLFVFLRNLENSRRECFLKITQHEIKVFLSIVW